MYFHSEQDCTISGAFLNEIKTIQNGVFPGIFVISAAASAFHECPLFVESPGCLVGFADFQKNRRRVLGAGQIQKLAQQTRSQSSTAHRASDGNIFDLPLPAYHASNYKSLKTGLLQDQCNPAGAAKQFFILRGRPVRRCGRMLFERHHARQVADRGSTDGKFHNRELNSKNCSWQTSRWNCEDSSRPTIQAKRFSRREFSSIPVARSRPSVVVRSRRPAIPPRAPPRPTCGQA